MKRQRSCNVPKLPKTTSEIRLEGDWAETHKGVVPLVYALLCDKSCTTYCQLFNVIRNAIFALDPSCVLNPDIVLSDFESGLIEAVRRQLPNAKHFGCHFHFSQAVWRKVQNLGLSTAYSDPNQPEISKFVQQMIAMAFIPIREVQEQIILCQNALHPTNRQLLNNFDLYFMTTWVDGLYPIKMWNKYGQDFLHRTNNRVESWHSTLKHKLSLHQNIFRLIKALKIQDSATDLILSKADAGESPPKRRPKYRRLENFIQKITNQHAKGEINTHDLLNRVRYGGRKFQ
jgi:hypothetical protein